MKMQLYKGLQKIGNVDNGMRKPQEDQCQSNKETMIVLLSSQVPRPVPI